jgi:hypothetical protein
MRCDECQNRLLDLVYGLLDPAEAAALEGHMASCSACTAAVAAARGDQVLFAQAAKTSFPLVRFAPPAPGVIETRRPTPRTLLVRWAVAAGVVLAVAGTVGPTIHSAIVSAAADRGTRAALAAVKQAKRTYDTEKTSLADRTQIVRKALESATNAHDAVLTDWVKAETAARNSSAFAVEVVGPASAVAGAPNEYRIRVADAAGRPLPAAVEVVVADSAGAVRTEAKFEPTVAKNGTTFRLPASVWTDLPAGAGLTLAISTTDPATGRQNPIVEPIQLVRPDYATYLVTDRPLYQPGETLYFRSVTLDRARLTPPEYDLGLRYLLLDAKGNPVPGLTLSGTATPTAFGKGITDPILGPDGKPVRGVGCGLFTLSPLLATGDYTLAVYELPLGWSKPELAAGSVPLAKRKVQIRRFAPSLLSTILEFDAASYGPGDAVTATVSAVEQGRPLANVQIIPTVTADGKRVPQVKAPPVLDAEGKAAIRFTLPADAKLTRAEVKVTLLHGNGEEVVRPVPLGMKTVRVEFFPEGGDLVAGVEDRVYFRVRTPDGKPVEFRGELFDGEKTVTAVTTVSDKDQPGANRGLGTVTFTPQAGKRYVLRGPAGEFPLPAAKADGVSLGIPAGVVGPTLPISVRLTAPSRKAVVVGAYTRGRPVATARAVLEPGKVNEVVLEPEPGSPGGVTRVTVFEESADEAKTLTPRAERLVFRRPAETLALNYSTAVNPQPGSPVSLTVTAQTEAGRSTGAILWTAVVSATDFGRADDRTTRSMPTHFYLCGDVESPDDMEYADFLLTDHPRAADSLDLVLGTQGWRRFAEQSPEAFRRTAPRAAADRLLVASGSTGPVPATLRPLVPPVADQYRVKYQRVLESVEAAEKASKIDGSAAQTAKQEYASALVTLNQVSTDRWSIEDWSMFRILAAVGLILVAGILLVVRTRLFRRGDPEWKYLAIAALAAIGLAGFHLTVVALSKLTDHSDVEAVLRQGWESGVQRSGSGGNPPPLRPSTIPPQAVSGERVLPLESPGAGAGTVQRSNPATSIPPGVGSPLESAANGRPSVRMTAAPDNLTEERLNDYAKRIGNRLAKVVPSGPAGDKVRDAVPMLPPFVVREYAHAHPDSVNANRNVFDATDTVLWQPVLVVPGTGTITLGFNLSGSTAGYRILVAGHTLDGRIGTVTGTLPVELPK